MDRITRSNLQAVVDRINASTLSPLESYLKKGDRYVAQVGNYHLDHNIGGWSLERMVNDGGGVTVVLGRGTARELWDQMHAFLRGFEAGREYPTAAQKRERMAHVAKCPKMGDGCAHFTSDGRVKL